MRLPLVEGSLERPQHADMLAFELEFHGQLKEPRCTRVLRVQSMSEARRRRGVRVRPVVHQLLRGVRPRPPAANQRQPLIEKAHARLDVATVIRAETKNACGDGVLSGAPLATTLRARPGWRAASPRDR